MLCQSWMGALALQLFFYHTSGYLSNNCWKMQGHNPIRDDDDDDDDDDHDDDDGVYPNNSFPAKSIYLHIFCCGEVATLGQRSQWST